MTEVRVRVKCDNYVRPNKLMSAGKSCVEGTMRGLHKSPNDEKCHACDGTGYTEEWRDIKEVIREALR